MRIKKIVNRLKTIAIRILKIFFHTCKADETYVEAVQYLEAVSPDVKTRSIVEDTVDYSINESDLSIIIPAYNVEKYIEQCVESVLQQETKFTYNIIIINDGSTDSTRELLEKYTAINNITIIDQDNRGLSGARNSGIDCAKGSYLMFVDSDDYLLPGAIDALMNCAITNDADCVEGNYTTLYKNGKEVINRVKKSGNVTPMGNFRGFMWGKVYRRKCFKGIRFPEKYWFEDSINSQILFNICKKCYALEENVYVYRQNDGSITAKSRTKAKSIDSLWITRQLMKERKEHGLKFDAEHYEYFLHMIDLTYKRTYNLDDNIRRCIFVIWCNLYNEYYDGLNTASKGYKKKLETALKKRSYRQYVVVNEMNIFN